jgi:L-2,4-diaminobutyrate decarboxylase
MVAHSIGLWHPQAAAHLHTPVLNAALAAETLLTALNPSMDSFDQAPAATLIELQVLDWCCRLIGLPATAAGTFTAGGTQSNYMGALLARDHYLLSRHQCSVREEGLPPDAHKLRILCSEVAHFSTEKAAIQLGLGRKAVVKIPADSAFRMDTAQAAAAVRGLKAEGLEPFLIVGTASTTDFGSIDPLGALADLAQAEGLWLHVDAAYGGALLMSQAQKGKLAGIDRADSVTMDFHKAFFQPISCGAFFLREAAHFEAIRMNADYLNPEANEAEGIPDLVTRSVLTTRRFDALKLWLSLQMIGGEAFGQMLDRLTALAEEIAAEIAARPAFELLHQPEFGCVVFRYLPTDSSQADALNFALPRRLFEEGLAVLGHTSVAGRACLKLTLNNPGVSLGELVAFLDLIGAYGHKLEAELGTSPS